MRHARYVYTAAALSAAVAIDQQANAETIDVQVNNLTVAATWRAQPAAITSGDSTTFKLSLKASGNSATSGISFGQSSFAFASGSGTSAPTHANLLLGATAPSAGSTATAMLTPLEVVYFEEGIHTATISTADAPITWKQGDANKCGTYSLDIGTKINVGAQSPTLKSASVPVLISEGEAFQYSALADAGLLGGLSYMWDFDKDGTFDSNQQNPVFAYDTAGLHTGLLRILGTGGSMDFQYAVSVTGAVIAVPVPTALWGGLGLVAAIAVIRAMVVSREKIAI